MGWIINSREGYVIRKKEITIQKALKDFKNRKPSFHSPLLIVEKHILFSERNTYLTVRNTILICDLFLSLVQLSKKGDTESSAEILTHYLILSPSWNFIIISRNASNCQKQNGQWLVTVHEWHMSTRLWFVEERFEILFSCRGGWLQKYQGELR